MCPCVCRIGTHVSGCQHQSHSCVVVAYDDGMVAPFCTPCPCRYIAVLSSQLTVTSINLNIRGLSDLLSKPVGIFQDDVNAFKQFNLQSIVPLEWNNAQVGAGAWTACGCVVDVTRTRAWLGWIWVCIVPEFKAWLLDYPSHRVS